MAAQPPRMRSLRPFVRWSRLQAPLWLGWGQRADQCRGCRAMSWGSQEPKWWQPQGSKSIQLLGRWSSAAVLRYTQDAALVRVPQIPNQVLGSQEAPPTLVRLQPQQAAGSDKGPGEPSSSSRSPRPKASASAMRSLRAELEMLKESVSRPPETFVFRPRARIIHKASAVERDNEPYLWKTPCGWSYGTSNYLRTTDISTGKRQCRKCFSLDDGSSSSSSDDSSDVADLAETSDSSAEDWLPQRGHSGQNRVACSGRVTVACFDCSQVVLGTQVWVRCLQLHVACRI